jgi:hypothetical protein
MLRSPGRFATKRQSSPSTAIRLRVFPLARQNCHSASSSATTGAQSGASYGTSRPMPRIAYDAQLGEHAFGQVGG